MGTKFKVGDTVERISGDHNGMLKGGRDIIISISGEQLELEDFGSGHYDKNLKLFSKRKDDKEQDLGMNYQFQTTSPSAINWEEIGKECTKEKPLVLVEVESELSKEDGEKVIELEKALKVAKRKKKAYAYIRDEIKEIKTSVFKEVRLCVHTSVMHKARMCGIKLGENEVPESTGIHYLIVQERSQITLVKDWVKLVQNAQWPDSATTNVKVKNLI